MLWFFIEGMTIMFSFGCLYRIESEWDLDKSKGAIFIFLVIFSAEFKFFFVQ